MSGDPVAVPAGPGGRSLGSRVTGALYAVGAYALWGFLPLYFVLLEPTGPWEVVAWRILLSLVFYAVLIPLAGGWARLRAILRRPRLLGWTAVAGVLIYLNWQLFVVATLSGHVIQMSLGYFINPIVTVMLGVLVLRERLRPMQWLAVGLAILATLVIVVGYGAFPWLALGVAFSFGFYGLVKKRIGPAVDVTSGLTLESLWLAPLAVGQLVVVALTTGLTFGTSGPGHAALLAMAGVVTAAPLMLFAAGARRVLLVVLGIAQFITPTMQLVIGVVILDEPMPGERWIGFGIVWLALIVFTTDAVIAARRRATEVAPDTPIRQE
ncbi:EamA family transporter RarD [Gordonia sp. PKS22-38]|uniref:EamA family transporter RarD n=1 Tax=Gordonia prachuapensis TaxID=3115651 RepID=A0ABU7MSC7_9ACTN|nr:EamA family transporter RarD [Gordonia sp. PKS22-38]